MNYRNIILEHLKKEKLQQLNMEMLAYEKFTDKQLDELLKLYKRDLNPEVNYNGELFHHIKEFKEALTQLENQFMEESASKTA